jgi:hypothetical protein
LSHVLSRLTLNDAAITAALMLLLLMMNAAAAVSAPVLLLLLLNAAVASAPAQVLRTPALDAADARGNL